jgi:hypothetical protein
MSILAPQLPFVRDQNGRGTPVLPNLPSNLPFTPGNVWHVRPRFGSDVNASGKNPQSAFKSLRRAHEVATKNQNDVVLLYSEGNAVNDTSDLQSVLLTWSKDLVHIIGVGSGQIVNPRSRIAFRAAADVATALFKVTANGCLFANLGFVVDVGTLMTGAVTVAGVRNHFTRCHFAGMVATDFLAGSSLKIDGGKENLFEECAIGVDTKMLGANANSQILFTNSLATSAGQCTRNIFKKCLISLWTNSATNAVFVRADANPSGSVFTIDRYQIFEDCLFYNSHLGTSVTYAFVSTSTQGQFILTGNTLLVGGDSWIVGGTTKVTGFPGINGAATIGIGIDLAHA